MDFSKEKLLDKFKNKIADKWHQPSEKREGNDGIVGNTLEDLLGVKENNLKIPDWGEIELKTKKQESKALITLLHREPQPNASVPKLLTSLGWKHQKAGDSYPSSEMSFRSTTWANSFTNRGFVILLKDNKIHFEFHPNKVNCEAADKTEIYPTYGDWLDDVERRKHPSHKDIFPIYWTTDYIQQEIINKLENTLFCIAKSKMIEGVKNFKYVSATLFKSFDASKIDILFSKKALAVDFDARTHHNHGTKFRVKLSALPELFHDSECIHPSAEEL